MVQFSVTRGHPLPISEGAEVCMGKNFKLLLEGWCLQQSCRICQEDNKYEKILSEGLATTEIREVKVCMNQNFKLLLDGWCLQQSCRIGQGDNKYEKNLSEGLATTEIRGVKVCMEQNFKLLLEGWCLQQSCRIGRGDHKYAKILIEGPGPTTSRGVKHIKNSVPTSRIKEKGILLFQLCYIFLNFILCHSSISRMSSHEQHTRC
jgi:hypothetical protein